VIDTSSHFRSLRSFLYLGVGGIGTVFLLMSVLLGLYWGRRVSQQSDAQIRILSRLRAQQALEGALLQQDIGLQGYVLTGEGQGLRLYREGVQEEEDAIQSIQDNLTEEEQVQTVMSAKRFHETRDTWHRFVEESIHRMEAGQLRGLRQEIDAQQRMFQRLREDMVAFDSMLGRQDNPQLGYLDRALTEARWIALILIILTLGAAILMVRRVIHKVAKPLVDLSEYAKENDGFPEPVSLGVREVDILSHALYELDLRVREREQILLHESEEAVASQMYMALLQQLSREEDVMEAFEQALRRTFQISTLRILMRPPEGDRLVFCMPAGGEAPVLDPDKPAPRMLSDAMACRAIRQGALVNLPADGPTACVCALGVPECGSYLCLPLVASGQTLGLVNLQSPLKSYWSSDRVRRASMLVSGTAASLRLIRALESAKERAIRDGLTGVYNRRFLDELTPKLVDQAIRKQQPLSLLMLDIDHFKRINDQFGHEAGDHVLIAMSRSIAAGLRVGDIVARYGGEEFTVFLPLTTYQDALALAERLRHAIATIPLPMPEFPPDLHIHASIGVATLPDQAMTAEALFSIADKALYEAKGRGRNRVVGALELGGTLG